MAITADNRKDGQCPKLITVNKTMSFNDFRRKCCDALKMDIVSIFSKNHRRITDLLELEKESEVLACENFYPVQTSFSFINEPSVMLKSQNTTKSNSDSGDKKRQIINVEIFGRPKAGKTTLIWKFVKNELFTGETNSIIEAVYEKDIDIDDQTVSLSITDVKELDDARCFDDRCKDKDVLMFLIPKLELRESKEWLSWAISRARSIPRNPLVVLVITQCDLRFGENSCRDIIQTYENRILVFKTSAIESLMSLEIKFPDELFLHVTKHFLSRQSSEINVARPSFKSVPRIRRTETNSSWILRPFESIGSCFGNMFR